MQCKALGELGQKDTDLYREEVGKLGGAVRTELSKLQENTWKQASSRVSLHSSTAYIHEAEQTVWACMEHFQTEDQSLRATLAGGKLCGIQCSRGRRGLLVGSAWSGRCRQLVWRVLIK